MRADAEARALRVDPGDRAAAGADREHLDRRHAVVPLAERGVEGDQRLAVLQQPDVEAGAAHVGGDHVGDAEVGGEPCVADQAADRPEPIVSTGQPAAGAAAGTMPPWDCISISPSSKPTRRAASSRPLRYCEVRGPTRALITVATVRSYSPTDFEISCETDDEDVGGGSLMISRARARGRGSGSTREGDRERVAAVGGKRGDRRRAARLVELDQHLAVESTRSTSPATWWRGTSGVRLEGFGDLEDVLRRLAGDPADARASAAGCPRGRAWSAGRRWRRAPRRRCWSRRSSRGRSA